MTEREPTWQMQQAQEDRCNEQGHEWEQGLTMFFQPVVNCKWCGKRREGWLHHGR